MARASGWSAQAATPRVVLPLVKYFEPLLTSTNGQSPATSRASAGYSGASVVSTSTGTVLPQRCWYARSAASRAGRSCTCSSGLVGVSRKTQAPAPPSWPRPAMMPSMRVRRAPLASVLITGSGAGTSVVVGARRSVMSWPVPP